jgi:cytochrome c oxidase subunit II
MAIAPVLVSTMQSALEPAGREAELIAEFFVWMAAGGGVIWAIVMLLAWYAPRAGEVKSARIQTALIVGGGVLLPVIVLLLLMISGLRELPAILAPAPDRSLTLEISGSQWWWRVKYLRPGREPIELANEIRLPVGRRIDAALNSLDVIHSFWIPSIAGKIDMIPGRTNRLALEPTRVGTYRGACAEFCGTSHARMNLLAIVMERNAFNEWLAAQAQPAGEPIDPVAQQGAAAFHEHGCNTCHTIRGTTALGVDGPDLTHVGGRQTLAAGLLPTRPEEFRRWISSTELLKPGAHMPAFAKLPDATLQSLAAYLAQLQ